MQRQKTRKREENFSVRHTHATRIVFLFHIATVFLLKFALPERNAGQFGKRFPMVQSVPFLLVVEIFVCFSILILRNAKGFQLLVNILNMETKCEEKKKK